jgi:hypothetical protein
MHTSIQILVASLVLTTAAHAQVGPPELIGPLPTGVSAAFEMNAEIALPNARRVRILWTLTISGRDNGGVGVGIFIDPTAIALSGDIEELEAVPAAAIFDVIAARSVGGSVALGYAGCAGDRVAVVSAPSCVTRTATGFAAATTALTRRVYGWNCSSSEPTVVLSAIWDMPECEATAEPTVDVTGASIE